MGAFFEIGLTHFVIVSFVLVAAGIATMLTKRNAIGILIGVELVLNAAAINLVAFNRYAWPAEITAAAVVQPVAVAEVEAVALPEAEPAEADEGEGEVVGEAEIEADPVPELEAAAAPEAEAVVVAAGPPAIAVLGEPRVDGKMFAIFIIVLAAAEAAVALAIFLNFYNNFSSIDVERADEMRG